MPHKIAKSAPAASDHAPLSVLNRTGTGIRTSVVCSCEWMPKHAPVSMSTMYNAHIAHRRKHGMPRFDYRHVVFGEGPWMGLTWDEWYAEHGGGEKSIDPYTGNVREF